MNRMKVLCAAVACLAWHVAQSVPLFPSEIVDGHKWYYFPMSGCVEIQSAPASLSGKVVVPGTLGGLPVVGIRPSTSRRRSRWPAR